MLLPQLRPPPPVLSRSSSAFLQRCPLPYPAFLSVVAAGWVLGDPLTNSSTRYLRRVCKALCLLM